MRAILVTCSMMNHTLKMPLLPVASKGNSFVKWFYVWQGESQLFSPSP